MYKKGGGYKFPGAGGLKIYLMARNGGEGGGGGVYSFALDVSFGCGFFLLTNGSFLLTVD